jgi:predicted dehydrogenase
VSLPRALPESTHVPLRGGPVLRWGVLAPGEIANDWTKTLHANTDQRVIAVASRSAERAQQFAAAHGVPRSYDSYELLVADPDVDVVYIAAPHTEHRRLALLAIAAGKHVLVEKPIGVSAAEAQDIADAARAAGVFAMEAMWSRFLPQTTIIARLLADGALGDLRTASADFGFPANPDPLGRHLNPDLGGGGLLDIGVYTIWFDTFALGDPVSIETTGELAATGVDADATVVLHYESGAVGLSSTSLTTESPWEANIAGSLARLHVDSPFMAPSGFHLVNGGDELSWRDETGFQWRDGLCYQATAVAAHIAAGRTEAPEHPLDTSIRVLRIIDEARRQLGAA